MGTHPTYTRRLRLLLYGKVKEKIELMLKTPTQVTEQVKFIIKIMRAINGCMTQKQKRFKMPPSL